jgi:hypothetical protein
MEVYRPVVVVVVAEGHGGERNREVLLAAETGLGRLVFWLSLDRNFSTPRALRLNIFIGDGRGTFFYLLVQNHSPWFDLKASQPLAQTSNDELSVLQEKWLVGLATLGRCHRLYSLDQPKRLTLACIQLSENRLRVRFIQFGEETRRQMPCWRRR